MQLHAMSHDQIMHILRDNGFRLTGPRQTIIDHIQRLDRTFTADDLVQALSRSNPDIGRATVFRTLDVLTELGILDRIHRPDGCHSYVRGHGRDAHYHHLICSRCGVVVPFEGCNAEAIYDDLKSTTDFHISGHIFEVFGVCGRCRS